MSLVLELRDRTSHAGTTLIHTTSEHVVLGAVFGVVKNLPFGTALNPWLESITACRIAPANANERRTEQQVLSVSQLYAPQHWSLFEQAWPRS